MSSFRFNRPQSAFRPVPQQAPAFNYVDMEVAYDRQNQQIMAIIGTLRRIHEQQNIMESSIKYLNERHAKLSAIAVEIARKLDQAGEEMRICTASKDRDPAMNDVDVNMTPPFDRPIPSVGAPSAGPAAEVPQANKQATDETGDDMTSSIKTEEEKDEDMDYSEEYVESSDADDDDSLVCSYDGCFKVFYNNNTFKKHLQTHKPRQHACSECGKAFTDKSKLKKHSLVHTYKYYNERPFSCEYDGCGKRFMDNYGLKRHSNIHIERPFLCVFKDCKKNFASQQILERHFLLHKH